MFLCQWQANGKPSYCGGHWFEKVCVCVCINGQLIEMNERMLQTILKWKIKEALRKREKPKKLFVANIDWRHSIKFSFISMLAKVELPFTMINFKSNYATIKWSQIKETIIILIANIKWSTVQYSKGNNVLLLYIYFEAYSDIIYFSHNSQ